MAIIISIPHTHNEYQVINLRIWASSSSSSSTATGGGAQYLCMPTDPEWNKFDLKNDSYAFSWLYAAEYLSYEGYGIFPDNVHGHNVACSVCLTTGTTKLMVPAKRTCPVGWDKQYEGYLMSSYVTDTKLTFECVTWSQILFQVLRT
ncbi:hypothetical protein EB796_025065 [Bugula neritina]|uniref:Uncharacterized protein n=1 Tax=Bugula neritina TaxID=10212 RepID=A0A7J7IT95_BUGNE|nr:hypothetical protein EB796_025065 [Bugula neritina]